MVKVLSRVEAPIVNRRALHAVAAASLISFFCILCAMWSWMPAWDGFKRFPGLICILPFWLPYGFVFLRVYQGRTKSGLVLAGVMACALLVPGIVLLRFVFEWERSWWIKANLGLALLMQPLLVLTVAVALSSTPLARRDWLRPSAYGISLFALFWLSYSPVPRLITHNESTAENRLREISLAVLDYSKEIGGGFYPDATCLIGGKAECNPGFYDHLQYLLRPEDGYIFDYRTVTSEASVRGCTVARSYRITARPIAYRKTGIRSFLVYQNEPGMKLPWPDEGSISVHATSEDREATSDDRVSGRVELFGPSLLLLLLCGYALWKLVGWFGSQEKAPLKWQGHSAFAGLCLATTSTALLAFLSVHAYLAGGYHSYHPFSHPVELFCIQVGVNTASLGFVAALLGEGKLRAPATAISALNLLLWLAASETTMR
jgi:hypothetical protein